MRKFYIDALITKSTESVVENDFFVEGYAATTDLDRQSDIIAVDALRRAADDLKGSNTVFFNHNVERCIGRVDDTKVDEKGLFVKVYISEWEKELRTKIREHIISKFSIGGRVKRYRKIDRPEEQKKDGETAQVTLIEDLELFEVSIVGLPANVEAKFDPTTKFYKSFDEAFKNGALDTTNAKEIKTEEVKEVGQDKDLETKEPDKSLEEKSEVKETEEKKDESVEEKVEEKAEGKDELSEEEVVELTNEEESKGDKDGKKPEYYYYYGKDIKEAIAKLDKKVDTVIAGNKDILAQLKELNAKVKEIEVPSEKATKIVDESIKKEDEVIDPDEGFHKALKE